MSETPYNIAWNIINRLSAADPAELFRKLASDAAKLEPLRKLGLTSSAILDLIWERENQSPTTIGCGLILQDTQLRIHIILHLVIITVQVVGRNIQQNRNIRLEIIHIVQLEAA